MKEQIQHRLLILLVLLGLTGSISLFLNNASFNPDFSMLDSISGATKKSHQGKNKAVSKWNYTQDDIALEEGEKYREEYITIEQDSYILLEKNVVPSKENTVVLLSNRENSVYQQAVGKVAEYLQKQGYHVQIKEYTETMMLSLVHAGHFDFFLMREGDNYEKME